MGQLKSISYGLLGGRFAEGELQFSAYPGYQIKECGVQWNERVFSGIRIKKLAKESFLILSLQPRD